MKKAFIPTEALTSTYISSSWRVLLNAALHSSSFDFQEYRSGSNDDLRDCAFVTIGMNGVTKLIADSCPIVSFWDDLHYADERTRKNRHNHFSKVSALLLTYPGHFFGIEEYSNYREKVIGFPWFSAYQMPDIDIESRPLKALLSGRQSSAYPLRKSITKLNLPGVDVLEHPGYNTRISDNAKIGKHFYEHMQSYKAAIATTGRTSNGFKVDYTVCKYFEIPAAGCLLIAEDTPDLENLGFRSDINYIRLESQNVKSHLEYIINRLDDFSPVALSGKLHIEKYHSITPRIEELCSILRKL